MAMHRLRPVAARACTTSHCGRRAVRHIHITATPAAAEPQPTSDPVAPDARFQVIGSPFSLLSVSLAASQNLYTRRGTLVGLSGSPEHTRSTLTALEPFRRAPVGVPFLYQKVSATSPVTALLSTKSSISSIVTVNLDGRQDWVISQRQALLAWTGHTLNLRPRYNLKLGFAHWGNTYITGRGLLALTGNGQIYQVQVKAGETYVAHPSNVVAYTASSSPPQPFRFKSTTLHFQVPNLGFQSLLQRFSWYRSMSATPAYRTLGTGLHALKTWLRRSIWGDHLFITFTGPTTLLLQSRASRLSDVLTLRDVDEIASSPPGAVQDAVAKRIKQDVKDVEHGPSRTELEKEVAVQYAAVRPEKTGVEMAGGKAEGKVPEKPVV